MTRAPRQPAIRTGNKPKYAPAIYIYMCKETAENGVLLKEYHCVHVSEVNYGKAADCNKIIRCKFNESLHF